jgi:CRP-like cAMP-binding protein
VEHRQERQRLTPDAARPPAAAPAHQGYGWIPLFQEVDEADLVPLLSRCEVLRLSAGTDLLHPGDSNDSLYILLSGELMVYLTPEAVEGQGIPIKPGHCIGEYSTIDRRPVSALVRCEGRRRCCT